MPPFVPFVRNTVEFGIFLEILGRVIIVDGRQPIEILNFREKSVKDRFLEVKGMAGKDEKIPDPKDVEKEISEFLSEKFGGRVKLITPMVTPSEMSVDETGETPKKKAIDFSLKPEELEVYLDQYVVKQDEAKAILSTKVCTHFNRVKYAESTGTEHRPILGNIKNNILMVGPTGVGKTYVIKLIADKIGVPFVKADATKFSETGYVGGDVEDLMRDLVREADDDIELAQYGIVYIDEIDKIAASHHLIGPDVSRTGVQRALLKPMEETDVDLKVPHDPISMLEEIERYRKTGQRKKRVINTKNILFIMSGAFSDLGEVTKKRVVDQGIGFGASIKSGDRPMAYLKYLRPQDLVEFGFETEFVGRLPVITVFEELTEEDLFSILKNPNNPVILSKKLDFKAYGIDVKFSDGALKAIAHLAYKEGTGARSLVSVVEKVLMKLEKRLPSKGVSHVAVTEEVVDDPGKALEEMLSQDSAVRAKWAEAYAAVCKGEKAAIRQYVTDNEAMLTQGAEGGLSESRRELISEIYGAGISDIDGVMARIESRSEQLKEIQAYFCRSQGLNVRIDEEAMDGLILDMETDRLTPGDFYKRLTGDFQYAFKLVRDSTGQKDFVITRAALEDHEAFLNDLVKRSYVREGDPFEDWMDREE